MKRENPIFPEDIIFEFLVRLPVKTLVRFRCVSKSWLILISTPQFIKTHLEFSSKEQSLSNLRVMVKACEQHGYSLKQFSALSLACEPVSDAHALDVYAFENLYPGARLESCCNGLVCISSGQDVFVLNPSTTSMSNKLPPVEPIIISKVYGLGYDESDDDYKVLAILWEVGLVVRRVVKLYSLRTNSWKRIDDFKAGLPVHGGLSMFLGGKIHLIMGPAWDIVSFDLKTQVYGTIEQPNYAEHATRVKLTVLGGSLCVLRHCEETRVDLWVLKEYGVKESWTKLVSISYPISVLCFHPIPLCILPNGKILLVFESHFLVYDLKDNSSRRSETSYPGDILSALTFIESLVSPTAYPDPGLRRQRRRKKYYPVETSSPRAGRLSYF